MDIERRKKHTNEIAALVFVYPRHPAVRRRNHNAVAGRYIAMRVPKKKAINAATRTKMPQRAKSESIRK